MSRATLKAMGNPTDQIRSGMSLGGRALGGVLAACALLAPAPVLAALALRYDPALKAAEKQAIDQDIAQL